MDGKSVLMGQKLFFVFMMMMIMSLSVMALGYIPSSDFILQQVVKNHGRGRYLIEQEVRFSFQQTSKIVHETWHIESVPRLQNKQRDFYLQMHLLAKAEGLSIQRLYKDHKVYQKDEQKALKSWKWPLDFIEPWFLTRSLRQIQNAILKQEMAGVSALNWNPALLARRSHQQETSTVLSIPMPISLSRYQGKVMLTYQTQAQGPGLWIEQDEFLIRRLRLKSNVEILAKDYGDYSRGLKFPKNRLINNNDVAISIRVLKIDSLSQSHKAFLQKMSVQSLAPSVIGEDRMIAPLIEDFYSRFR